MARKAVPALLFYAFFFMPSLSEFAEFFSASPAIPAVYSTLEALLDAFIVYLPLTALLLSPPARRFICGGISQKNGIDWQALFAEGFLGFLCLCAAAFAASNFSEALGDFGGVASLLPEEGESGAAICLMLAAGAALEETFFRYFLISSFEAAGLGSLLSSLLSIFLFAVPHIWEGLGGVLNALLAGFILSALYIRRRSLPPLILAHALYNITAFVLG
ncbi:MAG: CPBP family intramembrane metalloprotease [Spirochaetaceae bacterium]|jgi:membrane protease YdiL (CAAX protease family)|nr:CPBP family intramembrane metalloprotease [Spirochaetaceae bacterium]